MTTRRMFCSLTLGLLLAGLSGTAGAQTDGPVGTVPGRDEYRIGIEDVLQVVVWGEEELTQSTKVRPDGKISIPLANDVQVEGYTLQEARNEITRRLTAFIREPNVTLILEERNSFPVYVLGEVNQQGVHKFFRPTKLLQALASAGGLTQFASKQITVFRDEAGSEKRFQVNYKRVVAGEQDNFFLSPGDTLVVE